MTPSPPLWSKDVGAPLRGLVLARECGWVLAWDKSNTLHLYDRTGLCRGTRSPHPVVTAATVADDGSALALIGAGGEVQMLGPDFQTLWGYKMPQGGRAVALDSFGRFLAASDAGGNVQLFDRQGHLLGKAQLPKPLHRLAFIPEQPNFVGAADFGLVACFDAKAECTWRDGLVANVGSLSVSGSTIALAGFSPGLYCYNVTGPPHSWLPLPAPCRLAALRYDGQRLLMVSQTHVLQLVDLHQKVRFEYAPPSSPVDIALAPLGDWAVVALSDGTLLAIDLK